jgi:predicted nuclease of restriction endonuclease-like RecB superfamily
LSVSLHFLHSGELHAEIVRLIAYYERLLGQPQRSFSSDDARACVGEYRLANCLIATLSHWYRWQSREWVAVVQTMGASAELMTLGSPIQLRLALYDYVNARCHGFLSVQHRGETLQAFAAHFQLTSSDLEYLLLLDGDDEAVLIRETLQPPDAQAVVTLYNQWVFESALFNASSVHFVIDCVAFSANQRNPTASPATTTGVGSVIKRLCYLARRLGVYYDLEYQSPSQTSMSGPGQPLLLTLTLYGPQDVTGAPQQYGLRLARLCSLLLGYGVAKPSVAQPARQRKSQLTSSIVHAEARIHFLQKAYNFTMTANLLALLPPVTLQESGSPSPVRESGDQTELFDSSIEQAFAEAFICLANSQGADGWHLEREPEPLLLSNGLFIPDFAFTRGPKRIYMEILGFWTPSYRERKVRRLLQLQDRDDLLLAFPVDAREAFAEVSPHFPCVVYHDQLSATDILQMLRKHYDDFLVRLESVDVVAVRERVRHEGFLAERLCYDLLHCFRRSELQLAAERVVTSDSGEIFFVAGIGLYHQAWLEVLKQAFLQWLAPIHTTTLHEAMLAMRAHSPLLHDCADATIETLLGLWPEVLLRHDSIFDTSIELLQPQEGHIEVEDEEAAVAIAPVKDPKKATRERRASPKKRLTGEADIIQGDLWG